MPSPPKQPAQEQPAPPSPISTPSVPTPSPAPPAQQENLDALAQQRIHNIMGIQDVWHNLIIDVKLSQTNEHIALSLGLANDYLKQFIKFHKVLFEILKVASEYRRKGPDQPVSPEEKEHLLKTIENWKFQLR